MKNSSDEIVAGPRPAGGARHRDGAQGRANGPGGTRRGPGRWHRHSRPCGHQSRECRRLRRRGDPAARASGPGADPRAPVAGRPPPLPVRRTCLADGPASSPGVQPSPLGVRSSRPGTDLFPPGTDPPARRGLPARPGTDPFPPGADSPHPARTPPGRAHPSARHTPLLARGGPAAGAARLLSGRGGRRHLAPGGLPGRLAALDPRRRRLRLGLLVGRPPAHPSRQPVGHGLSRGPGRHPARLSHPDAPAGRADDPGHAHLRAERVLQPTVHRLPRPAVLRHVPGGPDVAAHRLRGDRRRRVLWPVVQPHLAQLVPAEPGPRRAVPAADPGGGHPPAPRAGPPPGRHPRGDPRRGPADRPGIGGAGGDPGGPGPDPLARTLVPAGPRAPARRPVPAGPDDPPGPGNRGPDGQAGPDDPAGGRSRGGTGRSGGTGCGSPPCAPGPPPSSPARRSSP